MIFSNTMIRINRNTAQIKKMLSLIDRKFENKTEIGKLSKWQRLLCLRITGSQTRTPTVAIKLPAISLRAKTQHTEIHPTYSWAYQEITRDGQEKIALYSIAQ